MINKDKISRVLLFDLKGNLLLSTKSVTFPKDFFKLKSKDLVMLKGKDFPHLSKDETVEVIFEYLTGLRMKYVTTIDLCTTDQINFHVSEGIEVPERRQSFKIDAQFEGIASFFMRDGQLYNLAEPVSIFFKNVNLGGVYFSTPQPFLNGDQVMLNFLDGEMQVLAEILRTQRTPEGETDGYGCRFLNISQAQEERLARFIFDCQLTERAKKLNGI